MARVASMVNFFLRRDSESERPPRDDYVPEALARSLDASAEDLRNGRIVDLGDSLREMEAELEAHLAQRKRAPSR
jgi:hypothetical protein